MRTKKRSTAPAVGALVALICVTFALVVWLVLSLIRSRPAPMQAEADAPVTLLRAAESPAPSPVPPTPPPSVLSFAQSEEFPLPTIAYRHRLGSAFKLRGTVQSNHPLTFVSVVIDCPQNADLFYPYEQTVRFEPGDEVFSYALDDADAPLGSVSLDSLTAFSELQVGVHTLTIRAGSTGDYDGEKLFSARFYVLSDDWSRISASDFSNNSYETALAFFGDKDSFLYRYQKISGRNIVADPDWENEYIIDFDGFHTGEPWRIHKSALPFYEKAAQYWKRAYVRVSGTNGDSGVIPLSALLDTYNGSYFSRFTSSLKRISHHAFGTATDLNAGMSANDNTKENLALIDGEVRDRLVYNGIQTQNGTSYYDFTYSGDYMWLYGDVPETIINYLFYELVFFRAGFQWGHYYNSTSDAMHFTLTDNIKRTHDESLRKVFTYIEEA